MEHAKLSASGSFRWLSCPGSVAACDSLEGKSRNNKTNHAAEEGTCAHELADICIKHGDSPHKYIGRFLTDAPSIAVDVEMAEHIEDYVDYCLSLGGNYFPEERVCFDNYVPDGFGTSDFFTFNTVNGVTTCDIVDLKYGRNIVDAHENTQGKLYALGVLQEYSFLYDVDVFVIHIYQPRIGNISTFEISTTDLLEWGNDVVKPTALEALSPNARMLPGEKQCQWCAFKGHCKSLLEFSCESAGVDFDKMTDNSDIPQVSEMSVDTLKHVLKYKTLIESWLKAIEMRVFEELENGNNVEGFKIVSGRSSRKWSNDGEVISRLSSELGDDLYAKKLLTAPQVEKLLGKSKFNDLCKDLVIKPPGKPTLVISDDKRMSLTEKSISDFD